MSKELHDAERNFHTARGRAVGAAKVASKLQQPALAQAREVTLDFLLEAGEAFAALERVEMEEGKNTEDLEKRNAAYWTWAQAQLREVML